MSGASILQGCLFLGAYSARSQTYAQKLAAAGLAPETALLFGDPAADVARNLPADRTRPGYDGQWVPDLDEPLSQTLDKHRWNTERSTCPSVNDPELISRIKSARPRLVIYSGYGGQLVKPEALSIGVPFLHMHAGRLPDFRGSTTAYYSLIAERRCAVSAIILNACIDEGPLLAVEEYPAPKSGCDIDLVYDNAIRADLLCRVLGHVAQTGELPDALAKPSGGETYYVIHPVLKHLAMLSLKPDA